MYVRNCYKKQPELGASHKNSSQGAISTHLCVRVSVHDISAVLQYFFFLRNRSARPLSAHYFAAVAVTRSKLRSEESSCRSSTDVVVGLRRKAIAPTLQHTLVPPTAVVGGSFFSCVSQVGGIEGKGASREDPEECTHNSTSLCSKA